MLGQGQSTGAGDNRAKQTVTQDTLCLFQKSGQCFLNIGEVTLIIRKQDLMRLIQNGDFNRCGTDIDSQCICNLCPTVFCANKFASSFFACITMCLFL